MSAEETDKSTAADASAGDEEEEWLYGGPAYGGTPVNLNIKSAGSRAYGAGSKVKGIDLEAPGSINGVPVLEVDMESFEEKPWRKPGADLSDYFNYGFNEDTWKAYCEKQKRLRMGLDIHNIGSTTSKISVSIINFPPPTGGPPPSLINIDNSGHPGGYDGRPVAPYPFPTGGFPPPMQGAVNPWPGLMDNPKQWDYYARRDKEREKERERDRPRERGHERDHSPSSVVFNSDEERYRSYRDYGDRGYERHRERSSREKEERHRERRHREKEEGRHKSSRSSSRRRHDSEEGDSHRRHKHKKSKRSKEGKEPSEERSADQENQEAME
uniref:Pre-mRNA 3'-end-processing factor FIP1 n=1 Tax=Sinocyclocheilus grahami TaxID=75366 RepID=A0A672LWQ7_SINGR